MEVKKNQKLSTGFTLIEILVTLATLGIILTVATSTFLTVITKSAKVKIVSAVENDGKYALGVMERMIRGAKEINGSCESGMDSITITNLDEGQTVFSFLGEGETDPTLSFVASSSSRLTSPMVVLETGSFDCFAGGVDEPDRVTITFVLNQAGSPLRVEEQASILFQKMVTMRNY